VKGHLSEPTDADRFLWVYQRRRELFPDCGCPPLEETARHLTENGRKRPRPGLRRLLRVRGQTAGGIGTRWRGSRVDDIRRRDNPDGGCARSR